jgi:hypothetical protein
MQNRKSKIEIHGCSCCSVRFRTDLCPQCYVAGCAHKGKGKPCRLSSDTQKTQLLPEFQIREAYTKLLLEHRKLTEDVQRLVRIIYAKDSSILEAAFGQEAVDSAARLGIALPSNGHAEFPPQPSVATALRGETRHG